MARIRNGSGVDEMTDRWERLDTLFDIDEVNNEAEFKAKLRGKNNISSGFLEALWLNSRQAQTIRDRSHAIQEQRRTARSPSNITIRGTQRIVYRNNKGQFTKAPPRDTTRDPSQGGFSPRV